MIDRYVFRVWHKGKQHMYKNVAIGVGTNKIGYKMSGKRRYTWEEAENIVVNQCTGFKDSHDKNIFEGDIVRFGNNNSQIMSVHWQDYKYLFRKKLSSKSIDKFQHWKRFKSVEVIGNIFENSELLNSHS